MDNEKRCFTCVFGFAPNEAQGDVSVIECRRYPPHVSAMQSINNITGEHGMSVMLLACRVDLNYVCGEYKSDGTV